MGLMETIFDLSYLLCVVALGLRMLLQRDKAAKVFAAMALVLGCGDAFHLLPRVISYWSEGGFPAHAAALSWGELVTSITMTLFYFLYYQYYKMQTGKSSRSKDYLVYLLVAARIIISLLPQNGWGQLPGNYFWDIMRNIPFALLGIFLIIWSWQSREVKGLKHMALLIALSFLFYIPVVLGGRFVPWLGALMLPKTAAYLLLVIVGYKNFVPSFSSRSLLEISFVNLILGLMAGVFYREFTKAYAFVLPGYLGKLHPHVLTLGFLAMLLLYGIVILMKRENKGAEPKLAKAILLWNIGLFGTGLFLLLHGIIEVLGSHYGAIPEAAIAGMAGLGHIVLALGIIWTMIELLKTRSVDAAYGKQPS